MAHLCCTLHGAPAEIHTAIIETKVAGADTARTDDTMKAFSRSMRFMMFLGAAALLLSLINVAQPGVRTMVPVLCLGLFLFQAARGGHTTSWLL